MGTGASTALPETLAAASVDDVKAAINGLSPENIAKIKAALAATGGAPTVTLSDEAKKKLEEKGWNKGVVGFGSAASEASVKLTSALSILKKEHTWVDLSWDDKALEGNSMGVKSADYKLISGGYCSMPMLCIDGVMYYESVSIDKMLAVESKAPQEVIDWIDYVIASDAMLLNAAKHWGWAGLHASNDYAMVNKEHYTSFGKGNKDEAWEKEAAGAVKAFLDKLEASLAAKSEINGCFVGNELTLADCVLCSWPLTLGGVCNVDLSKWPKVQENYEKMKAIAPEGMQAHLGYFPTFVGYVQGANKEAFEAGFNINKLL